MSDQTEAVVEKTTEIIKNAGERAYQQYEKLYKGINNADIVNAMFTSKEAYLSQLNKMRNLSLKLSAAGIVAESIYLAFKSDPYLDAINELSNKIDALSAKLTKSVEHLEHVIRAETYVAQAMEVTEAYEEIRDSLSLAYNSNGIKNDRLYKEFISEKNIRDLERIRHKVSTLITRPERGIKSISGACYGSMGEIHSECIRMLALFIDVNNVLGFAWKERYKTHEINVETYKQELKTLESAFLENINKINKIISGFVQETIDKSRGYITDFIQAKDLLESLSFSKEGSQGLMLALYEQFRPFEFFCSIYTGVGGDRVHSIGPSKYEDEYIALRHKVNGKKLNIVIYWWPANSGIEKVDDHKQLDPLTVDGVASAILPFIRVGVEGLGENKYFEYRKGKLDDTVQSCLLKQPDYDKSLCRAVALANCTLVNDRHPFSYINQPNPKKLNRISGHRLNKLYYAGSSHVAVNHICLYQYQRLDGMGYYECCPVVYASVRPEISSASEQTSSN